MFRFDFSVEPASDAFERYSRAFSRYGTGLKDYSSLFEQMAGDFYDHERAQFGSEGAAGGTPWAELSPGYAKRKQARWGFVHPILKASGALGASFAPGAPDNLTLITPLSMTVGSEVPYGRYHQTGTARMPKRPPIALSDAFKRRWDRTIHQWLRGQQDKAWAALLKEDIFREQRFVADIAGPNT